MRQTTASKIGFGTYRVSDENPEHVGALIAALESGVRLIDTSANYVDGHAELAIAKALDAVDDSIRDAVEIVSKFGYLQGENYERYLRDEHAYGEVVRYEKGCYHSIEPSFMHDQLNRSLTRLKRERIDCYLIHNPEYFLYDAIREKRERTWMLETMFDRIGRTFVALEREVAAGRIGTYGISSNSFAKAPDSPDFLPYEGLIELARAAAAEVGNASHGFTTVQLPINLLETEGLACAVWAKANGLRVIANRPLNAMHGEVMFRLADYEEPRHYFNYLNEVLSMCDNDALRAVFNLVSQLDEKRHRFGWIGEYDSFLYAQILPHVRRSLSALSPNERHAVAESLNLFFEQYRAMVAYECSRATQLTLSRELRSCEESLQACALKFLLENDDIDSVLVGMRRTSYVADIMGIPLEHVKRK